MRCLADVNVLLASAWEFHEQHKIALAWLTQNPWAYCALTETGFIRISLQPVFQRQSALDAPFLASLFSEMVRAAKASFWADREPFHRSALLHLELQPTEVTDAYLCDLSRQHSGKVATFDRSLCRRFPEHAILISAGWS
jgi:predicted nucleic acid-binding protein